MPTEYRDKNQHSLPRSLSLPIDTDRPGVLDALACCLQCPGELVAYQTVDEGPVLLPQAAGMIQEPEFEASSIIKCSVDDYDEDEDG